MFINVFYIIGQTACFLLFSFLTRHLFLSLFLEFFVSQRYSRRPFYRWLSHISSLSRATDCAGRCIELLRSRTDNMSLAQWNSKTFFFFFYTVTFVQSFAFNAVCTLSFNFTRWDYSAAGIVTAFHPTSLRRNIFRKKGSLIRDMHCMFSRGKV